jgi:hypothetical protein
LGRDFFWSLLSLASFSQDSTVLELSGGPSDFYSVFLQPAPFGKHPNIAQIRAEERERTDRKLMWIARNCKDAFSEWPVCDMLLSTGWKMFDDFEAKERVYVPHWNVKRVNSKNFSHFVRGVDYFVDRDEALIDHLTVFLLYFKLACSLVAFC